MSEQVLPLAILAHAQAQERQPVQTAMRNAVWIRKLITAHIALATAMRGRAVEVEVV